MRLWAAALFLCGVVVFAATARSILRELREDAAREDELLGWARTP